MRRSRWGAALGVRFGLCFFAADLLGASLAIGWLFDPTIDSTVLVALAGVLQVGVAVIVGVVVGFAWPVTRRPKYRLLNILLVGTFVLATAIGYVGRVSRNISPLPAVGEVRATRPVPILWVVIDTLRADELFGAQPEPQALPEFPLTNNLRQFAEEDNVIIMTDVESAAGWTIPSVATLFTGIHPVTLYSARHFIPEWAPTVAERLHAAGYRTHAVVDNALLEPRNGFAQGFQSFFQRSGLRFAFSLPGLRILPTRWRESVREHLRTFYYGAEGVTDAAIEVLNTAQSNPLFLYVHYMDPHNPYYAHADLPPAPINSTPANSAAAMTDVRTDPQDKPTPAEMRFFRHRYRNEIRYTDEHLGRLLRAWQEKYSGEALVMITADHGEEFGDHGGLGHGGNMYTELVHVPLIWRLPRSATDSVPQKILNTPVGQVDVLPTTLDIVGVSSSLGAGGVPMQGRSWFSWFRGVEAPPTRPLFGTQNRQSKRIYRYREGNSALVTTFGRDTPVRHEFFDRNQDPKELEPQDGSSIEARGLAHRFDPMMRAMGSARDPKPTKRDPSVVEEGLRALGYIQ